jgi:peptide chain release factor 2
VVEDGEGKVVRKSLAEVRVDLGTIYGRLAHLDETAHVEDMRAELATLEEKAQRPAFWDEAFGKEGGVVRRHRLNVELRRLDDLRGRAELVRKLVEASFVEAEDAVADDLVKEFVRLERQLARAEREIVHFDERDRGDCTLVLRAVGGKDGAVKWAKDLAGMYEAWGKDRKYDVAVDVRAHGTEVSVRGPYAYGYLKGERGGHRLIAPPPHKGDKRGDTFLARVEVIPALREGWEAPKKGDDEPPVRTYDLWRSRGVHDRRTGHSEGDVKRVLSGRIDAFLEAGVSTVTPA